MNSYTRSVDLKQTLFELIWDHRSLVKIYSGVNTFSLKNCLEGNLLFQIKQTSKGLIKNFAETFVLDLTEWVMTFKIASHWYIAQCIVHQGSCY